MQKLCAITNNYRVPVVVSRTFFRLPFPLIYSQQTFPPFPSTNRLKIKSSSKYKHNYTYFSSFLYLMDFRLMGFNHPLLNTLYHIVDEDNHDSNNKNKSEQARSYVRDAKVMATTPADVKEYPNSYVFVVDMPGLKSGDIKVQVEEDNVLVVCGERKREKEKEGVKYVRMERKVNSIQSNRGRL
ncbi:putative class II heat shock protein [Heracleum sosnowskyi]|uniref:Class II heat shock protein n=1 Tax=Heracleum sosnowskyi TaxID=360622 RepID=A0AAD8M3R9_9APIA|nr:putative class II heat shock protein [Heracleum sosnowskyi]